MKTVRLNAAFTDRQHAALERMAKELETTKAGVLKTALALLELALREKRQGNQLAVTRDNVILKEITGY